MSIKKPFLVLPKPLKCSITNQMYDAVSTDGKGLFRYLYLKQAFIIGELKPYFLDPSTCGVNKEGNCVYYDPVTENKCVFGKRLKDATNVDPNNSTAYSILNNEGYEVCTSGTEMLNPSEWNYIQDVHDTLATDNSGNVSTKFKIVNIQRVLNVDLSELVELLDNPVNKP